MSKWIFCCLTLTALLCTPLASQAMESASYMMEAYSTHTGYVETSSTNFTLQASTGGVFNGEPEESELGNYTYSMGFWRMYGVMDLIVPSLSQINLLLLDSE